MNYQEDLQISYMEDKNTVDVIKLCKEALLNASAAYEVLHLLGFEKHLPGLPSCELNCKKALKAIERLNSPA